jgi:diaminohydroxyphosphoribosylaminopyrimidine deaminase/5-amino-6-(5-phosphoribosylamino)uracil reductase
LINVLQVKHFVVFFIAMTDEFYMAKALALASRARGQTSPNPMVGAVLVKKGKIIGEGYHKKAGGPHAEVIAIDNAGERTKGATLYVNLEPCCHKDKRTPPCTRKIIAAGIKKVVTAMKDPNPKVSGKGITELESAGIKVVSGVLEEKAVRFNEFYTKHITTGLPFVLLKVAMTLDGKIATPEGESKWITGEKARAAVHGLRGSVDAILSAIGTVKADNPRLTCRTAEDRDPVRVIIDPRLEVRPDSNVLCIPPETIIVTRRDRREGRGPESEGKKGILMRKGARIIEYEGDKVGMKWLLQELGSMGITSLLVEGGSSLNSYCLESGIVDKVMFFIAPKIIGGRNSFPAVGGSTFRRLEEAYRVEDLSVKRIGEDVLIEGYVRY